eukprot:3924227-Rhodomonas_salina.3
MDLTGLRSSFSQPNNCPGPSRRGTHGRKDSGKAYTRKTARAEMPALMTFASAFSPTARRKGPTS